MPLNKSLSLSFFLIHLTAAGIGRKRGGEKAIFAWFLHQGHSGTHLVHDMGRISSVLVLSSSFSPPPDTTAFPVPTHCFAQLWKQNRVFILLYLELHQPTALWKEVHLLFADKLQKNPTKQTNKKTPNKKTPKKREKRNDPQLTPLAISKLFHLRTKLCHFHLF